MRAGGRIEPRWPPLTAKLSSRERVERGERGERERLCFGLTGVYSREVVAGAKMGETREGCVSLRMKERATLV